MHKVKLLTLKAGPEGIFPPGSVLSVSYEEGQQLVDGGYAVWADPPVKDVPMAATEPPAPTEADVPAPKRKR